jgi:hypothetical protein
VIVGVLESKDTTIGSCFVKVVCFHFSLDQDRDAEQSDAIKRELGRSLRKERSGSLNSCKSFFVWFQFLSF